MILGLFKRKDEVKKTVPEIDFSTVVKIAATKKFLINKAKG
jgi:hypothetical protein